MNAKATDNELDLFASIADDIKKIEEDAAKKKQELHDKLQQAAAGKIEAIKADLEMLVKNKVGADWYAILGLTKPAGADGSSSVGSTGSTTERAKRGTAQGQAKKGVVYSCPDGWKHPTNSKGWAEAGETWQTGARGVPNPKPDWLEAWIGEGKRWADLETQSAVEAPGEVKP